MTNVLIATKPDDLHAICVKLALDQMGHHVDLLYTADFPSKSTYSFAIAKNKFYWRTNESSRAIYDNDYDTIWYRRPAKPVLPDYLHPADVSNAKKENLSLYFQMWPALFPHSRWINPITAAQRANSKLLQLKVADLAQLNIPETLVSNDPDAIKYFINQHQSIYKSIFPVAWVSDNEVRLTYTKNITVDELPSDKLLSCTPGIFQKQIEKKHELRITYFGNHYIAVKIDSQSYEESKIDWRSLPLEKMNLEQVELPHRIDQACRDVMQQLGISFGCFDFIVTPDDEYYFLEVNEQGQFLWIELLNPKIKMLELFCEFITKDFRSLSIHDLIEKSEVFMKQASINHINPPQF